MTPEQFGGVLRAVLAAAAGYVAGKGLITAGVADQLVGAGVTIGVAIWSALSKKPAA
jgi:predicted GH43/DUF377 family glycosyl hydrolase